MYETFFEFGGTVTSQLQGLETVSIFVHVHVLLTFGMVFISSHYKQQIVPLSAVHIYAHAPPSPSIVLKFLATVCKGIDQSGTLNINSKLT
jgi:hypothetical protein